MTYVMGLTQTLSLFVRVQRLVYVGLRNVPKEISRPPRLSLLVLGQAYPLV